MHSPRKQALIIFAKRPVPGRVKTRLIPPLTAVEAARLYECMLRDILRRTSRLTGMDRLIFNTDEPAATTYFRRLAPGIPLFPQQGEDLGARMASAFSTAFARGYQDVAIIGSDSPDLPLAFIENAFAHLTNGEEAVFGPSEDGGYYLVALGQMHAELFDGIEWSRNDVLARSLGKAAEAGIRVALLPGWYDVDTVEDLQRPELRNGANDAPLTREFIESRLGTRGAGL
ncbi:TIGR04282 family arsenosugar biosynthesis glycosyltransferase [Geobacter sp. AOG1]|uniref:TIGR04282 family arsenosugar biosynthesis glycosyltransferase n=1 Tax=Geobacter sp. AOG1 TaxID=1566346 RepID=UPI001CC666D8|nr:TIGR04282 family arsenosugar biosynthesis glycosyltransferase [Geobacter sp. AOG1]GFE56203.1 hypothetical protein AOG1_00810 [Geobacter sp. AOG1]